MGEDEAAIRQAFGERTLNAFTAGSGWSVEGRDQVPIVYREGKRLSPALADQALERAIAIQRCFALDASSPGG